jgi:CheY-like chemotaxis protein
MIPLVLSIDDDHSSQMLMAAYLKDVNFCHSFVSKANGQEALDYFQNLAKDPSSENWPNIIFLDIKMPVLDGWGFLEGFTDLAQGLQKIPPVVMVSATNTAGDISRAEAHPLVTDLIIKPISSTALKKLSSLPELCDYFSQDEDSSANPATATAS